MSQAIHFRFLIFYGRLFLYFPVCKFQDKVSLEMVVDNGFQHSVKREIVTAWCQTGKWPVVNVSFKVNNLKF